MALEPQEAAGVLGLATPPAPASSGAAAVTNARRVAAPAAPAYWSARLERGLPFRSLAAVMKRYELSRAVACRIVGLSERSFLRRRKQRKLSPIESDRLYRLAEIVAHANRVFEDTAETASWLRAHIPELGEARPLDLLSTEAGTRQVDEVLHRIEHGFVA